MSCYPRTIFVEKNLAATFICPICQGVLRDPVSEQCRQAFGRECLRERALKQPNCPECKKPLAPAEEWAPAHKITGILSKAQVRCQNGAKCPWQGKLEDLAAHLKADCLFAKVKCPNQGCDFFGERYLVLRHKPQCSDGIEEFHVFGSEVLQTSQQLSLPPDSNPSQQRVEPDKQPLDVTDGCSDIFLNCDISRIEDGPGGKDRSAPQDKGTAEEKTARQALLASPPLQSDGQELAEVAQIRGQLASLADEIKGLKQGQQVRSTEVLPENKHSSEEIDSALKQIKSFQEELDKIKQAISNPGQRAENNGDDKKQLTEGISELKQIKASIDARFELMDKKCEELRSQTDAVRILGQSFHLDKDQLLSISEMQTERQKDNNATLLEGEEGKKFAPENSSSQIKEVEKMDKPVSNFSKKLRFSKELKSQTIKLISLYEAKADAVGNLSFVLLDKPIVSNKKYSFHFVELASLNNLSATPQIYIGICFKTIVQGNSFEYKLDSNHGSYMIRSDGLRLYYGFAEEKQKPEKVFGPNDVLELTFDSVTRKLQLEIPKTKKSLFIEVEEDENEQDLYPCFILTYGAYIKILNTD